MKKTGVIIFAICLVLAVAASVSCGKAKKEDAGTGNSAVKYQVTDAVSGKPVNRNIYADFGGKRIYFCCEESKQNFGSNPDLFLRNLKNQGITLEDSPVK